MAYDRRLAERHRELLSAQRPAVAPHEAGHVPKDAPAVATHALDVVYEPGNLRERVDRLQHQGRPVEVTELGPGQEASRRHALVEQAGAGSGMASDRNVGSVISGVPVTRSSSLLRSATRRVVTSSIKP